MVSTRSRNVSRTLPRRSARLSGAEPSTPDLPLTSIRRVSSTNRRKSRSSRGNAIGVGRLLLQRRERENAEPPERQRLPKNESRPPKKERMLANDHVSGYQNDETENNWREAKVILRLLQENFECPLCFDIVANPYVLSPAHCGHTFCAMCVLKWFFARLHRACGGWHEPVKCPLCRALLILTPDEIPREIITVPFTPNRLAEDLMNSMIGRLSILLPCSKGTEKQKRIKAGAKRKSVGKREPCKTKGNETAIKPELASDGDGSTALSGWTSKGGLRKDWVKRSRLGRKEMNRLLASWPLLTESGFIAFKDRLGV